MKKIAIFVEGQTELITVRELILRKFDWYVSISCYSLYSKGNYKPCDYSNTINEPSFHFEIYSVGGDQSVLSEILLHEDKLIKNGFEKIIGLRDMYSKNYRKFSQSISIELNETFIKNHLEQIEKNAINANGIKFCFAIMEIESWFLGVPAIFREMHEDLTCENIESKLGLKLELIDPEQVLFHPAKTLEEILEIVGIAYDKKKGDVEAICSLLNQEHYVELYNSNRCSSFNKFYDTLFS